MESTFEYSGLLMFRPVDISEQTAKKIGREHDLPQFEHGTPEEPGSGFKHINIQNSDFSIVDSQLLDNFRRSVQIFRHFQEIFGSETNFISNQGKKISGKPISEETSELILTPDHNPLARGNKKDVRNILRTLTRSPEQPSVIELIKFERNFLLWIFWQHFVDERIGSADPFRLNKIELTGGHDTLGQNAIYEGTDIARSSTVVISILSGKNIQTIAGVFNFDNFSVDLEIRTDGTIYVRAAEDIRKSSQLKRFLTAGRAADSIVDTYRKWTNLPTDRKYPPRSFYFDLREFVEEEGFNVEFPISEVVERSLKLRGEEY